MLERINDNSYKLDLLCEYKVSTSFNFSIFPPFDYVVDNSRLNPFEKRWNDGNCGAMHIPNGSITRSKAKQLNEALNRIIQELKIKVEAQKVLKKEPKSQNSPLNEISV